MRVVKKVKRLVQGPTAKGTSATITLGDRDREFTVVLDPSLPDDAYQQLFDIDLSLAPAGVLTWDYRARGWQIA